MFYTEKMRRSHEYVYALEEERRKIQVFQRELPLCLELVTQAIDSCKQKLGSSENNIGRSECSEQTSSEGPVLEEFIPLKRSCSSEEDDEEQQSQSSKIKDRKEKMGKKSDWLRSVQLWNNNLDLPINQDSPKKTTLSVIETKRSGGAFHPFHREKEIKTSSSISISIKPSSTPKTTVSPAATSSTAETTINGGSKKEEREGDTHRKARRCWSPELHRRFLQALQQLGGSHAATPKQIRELMKVDGLTNDEVKSHLQKYRLHARRPAQVVHNNNGNHQQPQFLVVGGIWVPPPEYSPVTGAATGETKGSVTVNGIYTSVATGPPPATASHSPEQQSPTRGSRVEHSNSMGDDHDDNSSSSTHTTTASPA